MENIFILKLLSLCSETKTSQTWYIKYLNRQSYKLFAHGNVLPNGDQCFLHYSLCTNEDYVVLPKKENDKFHENDILFVGRGFNSCSYLEAYVDGLKIFDELCEDGGYCNY